MQHQGSDYGSSPYYPHQYPSPNPNPNPNPNEFLPPPNPSFASAPPYSSNYSTTAPEFPTYPFPYPSYAPPPPVPDPNPSHFPHTQQPPPTPQPAAPSSAPYPHLQQPPYHPYEGHYQPPSSAASIYGAAAPPPPNPNPSPYAPYENHDSSPRFDHGTTGGGYFGSDSSYKGYDRFGDDGPGDGVYAYDGGRTEPYGARGNGGFSRLSSDLSSTAKFDDYGRSIGAGGKDHQSQAKQKIVRAVPKMDMQQDSKNGVQKFRVKLLSEGASVGTTDVLCQIGLDGIRMLDTSTSRTLRIYPLENVTRWEVLDSSIFAFWSKSSVDIEPRRIRLQSNSYTTNTILDIVTAATVQLKEMGGQDNLNRNTGADSGKPFEQTTEKKKVFDWMNLIKPGNEEKDHWVPDEAVSKCTSCASDFGAFLRRHHCRNCGDIFCDKCTQGRIALTADEQAQPVRICDRCMAEVSHRLSIAKDIASKSTGLHRHEDLAKKLQEEMEKNRKSSSGSKSTDGSGRRMREVACPICTVHLQIQVPTSGSETIECGVCQHPFLVSAH